ncbi:MAG TPA: TonB-dependent receptor [Mariniphaga anaerophila]|uniref:TonB-dependent receptor n=1 Tax=Mariniphaga anaerophila TaxID=1484053 RepID=A0A831LJ36_9BACT|nr:TonB-dependent receptor [Mariniphaga anaerophila]
MKKIVLVFFVLFLFIKVNAQNQIKGTVTDLEKNPLGGATIYLPEMSKGTITDANGEFLLNNLPNGDIKIQFSFLGYNTQMLTVNMTAQNNIEIKVKLTTAVIQSQEVVVTGGYVSSQHENAVKIDVLSQKAIFLRGTSNFMEALTSVPGVDMISKGQGVSKPVIRGLSMNDILVLNNGVRIENYQYGENHPLGIDGSNIERVEIVKGPASLLYGSDAIGGVLNFIKPRPAPQGKIEGEYRAELFSNTRGISQAVNIKGASKNLNGGIWAGQRSHADYLQGGGSYAPNTRFNEKTISASTGYTARSGTFKLFYDYFKQDLGMLLPASIPLVTERGRKNEVWYQNLEHQLLSSQNTLCIGKYRWATHFAWQNALRKLHTTLDVPFVEMKLNTITFESKLHLPVAEKTEYIAGIQGMVRTNRNLNNRASQFLPDADIHTFGFLGLVQHTFFSKVKLQGGLRYDLNTTETYALGTEGTSSYIAPINKQFSNVTGSVGGTFSQSEKLMWRANFVKAWRSPNLSELTSNGLHGNRFEKGNHNLLPQNAREADMSMHYHGEFASFDMAVFSNRISNYIYLSPTNENTPGRAKIYGFSQTNARLYGGESGIHFHPPKAPWLHFEGTWSVVTGKQENGDYLPFIPASKFRYEIRAEGKRYGIFNKPGLKLSALTALKQNKPSPFETPFYIGYYCLCATTPFKELLVVSQDSL